MQPLQHNTLESYLEDLCARLDRAGVVDRPAAGPWRDEPVTPLQLGHLEQLGRRLGRGRFEAMGVPGEVIAQLGRAWTQAPSLTRGAAMDFLVIVRALARYRWPDVL